MWNTRTSHQKHWIKPDKTVERKKSLDSLSLSLRLSWNMAMVCSLIFLEDAKGGRRRAGRRWHICQFDPDEHKTPW